MSKMRTMARLILTADDSPSIRLLMKLTLTAEGYEVMQASDGVEALEIARHHEAALGRKFDQKKFHDFILSQGLLPPDLMRKAVLDGFVPTQR